MRFRLLLLLPALLVAARPTLAQTYQPGLLVRSTGDTLRGEVENGFWVEPPTLIRFRAAPASPSQQFRPDELRAVRFVNGRAFRYEAVPIDYAAREKTQTLERGNIPAVRTTYFLTEVLAEGAVSLVRVALPGVAVHYVLLAAGRPPLALSEHAYLRQEAGGAWLSTNNNNYRGQLGIFFGDCPAASQAAQTAPFTAKGLAAVVHSYNTACGPRLQASQNLLAQTAATRSVAWLGGIIAGARYNRLQAADNGPCLDCGFHPYGGLYTELLLPARTTGIYGELGLSSTQGQTQQYFPAIYSYGTFSYKALLATARAGVRFYSPLPHEQQLLVGLSYEVNYVFKPTYTAVPPVLLNQQPDDARLTFARPALLPDILLGWRQRHLTVSADLQMYATPDNTNSNTQAAFFGNAFAVRLGLAYRLGRNSDQSSASTNR